MDGILWISQHTALIAQYLLPSDIVGLAIALHLKPPLQAASLVAAEVLELNHQGRGGAQTPRQPLVELQHSIWTMHREWMQSQLINKVRCGRRHSLLVNTKQRSAIAFGNSAEGKLGKMTKTEATSDTILVQGSDHTTLDVVEASAGYSHSVFINGAGQVFVTGLGLEGRLGLGNELSVFIPTLLPMPETVQSVACGGSHTLLLTRSGDVYAMGFNQHGRLGIGDFNVTSSTTPIPIIFEEQPRCDLSGESGSVITGISAGSSHSLAWDSSGRLYSWGQGQWGRLGHGDELEINVPSPQLVSTVSKIVQASAGGAFSLAVDAAGRAWAFGVGGMGQLGLGGWEPQPVPVHMSITNALVVKVAAGGSHSLLLTACGNVLSCGNGSNGRLGHGAMHNEYVPRKIEFFDVYGMFAVDVSAGGLHSLVATASGKVFGFGSSGTMKCTACRCRECYVASQSHYFSCVASLCYDPESGQLAHSSLISELENLNLAEDVKIALPARIRNDLFDESNRHK